MKFWIVGDRVNLENYGDRFSCTIAEFQQLEPDFAWVTDAFEQWTPELHYVNKDGNQQPPPPELGDRSPYLAKIDQYRAAMPEPQQLNTQVQWQNAYMELLRSPVFERVQQVGKMNPAVSQARADLGTALQSLTPDEFKQASVSRAIADLDAELKKVVQGFAADEKTWIKQWNDANFLGINLPWV
ncbi:MAG: hypothetical protein F6K04_01330 [Leptolyngbya sp. SIO4C5]|nr:hypothetical protein [Leptolyngbya sp. SIO4C5]